MNLPSFQDKFVAAGFSYLLPVKEVGRGFNCNCRKPPLGLPLRGGDSSFSPERRGAARGRRFFGK